MTVEERDWREWAAECGAALDAARDSKFQAQAREQLEHLRTELDAALRAEPLHLGIRTDADFAAAVRHALHAADSDAALAVLRERLTARLQTASDLLNPKELPAREWIVDGWLPANRAGILAGRGGAGKSRLALQLACAVAAGTAEWLGKGPVSGPTVACARSTAVLASWEDELADTMRRCRSMAEALPWLTREAVRNRIHWIDASPHGPLWGPSHDGSRHVATSAELTPAGSAVRAYCESVRARLLILDPLAAVYASDENVRGLVRHFMTSWDAWARRTRCAVMLIAHPPKSDAEFSGSTDWENASRWMWSLSRSPTGWWVSLDGRTARHKKPGTSAIAAPCLKLAKANYGRPGRKAWLRSPKESWASWQQCSAAEAKDAAMDTLRQQQQRVLALSKDEDEEPCF